MNKLKLNSSSITFLPILVCIPIAYELFINFHIGGIELFKEFIISALNPKINNFESSVFTGNYRVRGKKIAFTNSEFTIGININRQPPTLVEYISQQDN